MAIGTTARRHEMQNQDLGHNQHLSTSIHSTHITSTTVDTRGARNGAYFVVGLFLIEAIGGLLACSIYL
jgi:hypothetical protein